mgnify:CR=1 FL=1
MFGNQVIELSNSNQDSQTSSKKSFELSENITKQQFLNLTPSMIIKDPDLSIESEDIEYLDQRLTMQRLKDK